MVTRAISKADNNRLPIPKELCINNISIFCVGNIIELI